MINKTIKTGLQIGLQNVGPTQQRDLHLSVVILNESVLIAFKMIITSQRGVSIPVRTCLIGVILEDDIYYRTVSAGLVQKKNLLNHFFVYSSSHLEQGKGVMTMTEYGFARSETVYILMVNHLRYDTLTKAFLPIV